MENTNKIYKLEGRIQHYAWGGFTFLPELLQVPNVGNKPFAEYWMGAHSKAPSLVSVADNTNITLDEFLGESNVDLLGVNTAKRFSRLPYLFKILDVKDMLSIQVHPTKQNAVLEFEAENKKGILLDDPKRNYKDDNHKPELMYALSDFWLLHGFKTPGKLVNIFATIPELGFLQKVFEKEGYTGLYQYVMELSQDEVNTRLQPLIDRILPLYAKEMLQKEDENFWAARAAMTFNEPGKIDRGIFSIYIFNLVNLQQGESIFQDAGIPHAYLEGQNVEIMANSDNVLRGGLTPKHIDVPELLKHTKCEALVPAVIMGIPSGTDGEQVFLTPAADFELRLIEITAGGTIQLPVKTADIFFVFSGRVSVGGGGGEVIMNGFDREAGESFMAVNGATVMLASTVNSMIFRATVPGA